MLHSWLRALLLHGVALENRYTNCIRSIACALHEPVGAFLMYLFTVKYNVHNPFKPSEVGM